MSQLPGNVERAVHVLLNYLKADLLNDLQQWQPEDGSDEMLTSSEVMERFGKFGLGSYSSIKKFARKHNVAMVNGHTNRYSRNDISNALKKV